MRRRPRVGGGARRLLPQRSLPQAAASQSCSGLRRWVLHTSLEVPERCLTLRRADGAASPEAIKLPFGCCGDTPVLAKMLMKDSALTRAFLPGSLVHAASTQSSSPSKVSRSTLESQTSCLRAIVLLVPSMNSSLTETMSNDSTKSVDHM